MQDYLLVLLSGQVDEVNHATGGERDLYNIISIIYLKLTLQFRTLNGSLNAINTQLPKTTRNCSNGFEFTDIPLHRKLPVCIVVLDSEIFLNCRQFSLYKSPLPCTLFTLESVLIVLLYTRADH